MKFIKPTVNEKGKTFKLNYLKQQTLSIQHINNYRTKIKWNWKETESKVLDCNAGVEVR